MPIVLAQVQAGKKSENLLNKIHQIVYYLYQAKQITKKVYNNTMNSNGILHLWILKTAKTSEPHRL